MFTPSDIKRGFSNAGWLLAGNYASQALSLVTMVVIARKLGPEGYGMLSTATAFIGLFSVFHLSGFDRVFLRQSVANPDEKESLYARLLGLKLRSGVAGVVIAISALFLFSNYTAQERLLVVLFSLTLLTQAVNSLITSVFQVHEDMQWLSVGNLARQTLYILVAGIGLWAGFFPDHRVIMVMSVLVASYVCVTAFYAYIAARYVRRPLVAAYPRLSRDFIKAGVTFSLATLVVYLYTKVDILMARAFVTAAEVGLYSVCMNTVDRLTSPLGVMLTAFFPSAVRRIHERGGADMGSLRRIAVGFGLAGVGVASVGTLLAPWAVPLILGEGYSGAVAPLRVLLWAVVPTIAMMPLVTALQASRHEDAILRLAPLRAGLNVVLDFAFLSAGHGILGVAWGSVITSVAFNGVFLVYASKRLRSGIRAGGGKTA